jgi:hypothetical protein
MILYNMFSKLERIALLVVAAMIISVTTNAQTGQNSQQTSEQKQLIELQEELQKFQEELQKQQGELTKQQEELQSKQKERLAEMQKRQVAQQAEMQKRQVVREAEMQKRQAEMQKRQVVREAEMQKRQAAREVEMQKRQVLREAEMLKRQAERQKQQVVREAEMLKRQAEMQKMSNERQKLIAEKQVEVQKMRIEVQKYQAEMQEISKMEKKNVQKIIAEVRQLFAQLAEIQRFQGGLSEYEKEIIKEFQVSSSSVLSINNMYGNIEIIEGGNNKIVFNIKVIGKGKDADAAKEYAESVAVDFRQNGNNISANTLFRNIKCDNCGRQVFYEVIVPKNAKLILENKYGDISMNNTDALVDVNLQFGKLSANELSEANLVVKNGGATVNKCGSLKINSSFSNYNLGIIETMTGIILHDRFLIGTIGSGDLESDFTNIDIDNLNKSLISEKFSYGSLKVGHVADNFSEIKMKANFASVQIAFTEKHNFKALLSNSFGIIKTGSVIFYEKSEDKNDVVNGIVGKLKEPTSIVEISNSHGKIVFE